MRPESIETPPWFRKMSVPSFSWHGPAFSGATIPGMSGAKGPRDWKAPAWMRGRQDVGPLLAEDAERNRAPYHDDYDEDAMAVRASVDAPSQSQPSSAVEEVVVGKKDKGKGSEDPNWSS